MNQILSTSMPRDDRNNKRNNNPASTKSVLKFFGIAICIFGILLIGAGGYMIYESQTHKQQELEPTISIENINTNTIMLKITNQKVISQIKYSWNDEEEKTVNGNNGKYLEPKIAVPSGTNTLHLLIIDEDGKEITYEKQYEVESNINFEVSGNKIKITYNGEKNIAYITYRWDEEEEQRIDIYDTILNEEIDAIRGLHTLTVVVVDEDNNMEQKQQKINGVSKPKVSVKADDSKEHFVIDVSDEEVLSKIVIRLDEDSEQEYEVNLEGMDLKEATYVVPDPIRLKDGENTIEVTVYNASGISGETGVVKISK